MPCPPFAVDAAVWHGVRLAIRVSRIPVDALRQPPTREQPLPHKKLLDIGERLSKACGYGRGGEDGMRRTQVCFWGCVQIASFFLKRKQPEALDLVPPAFLAAIAKSQA
jgi:hypothetical protein